MDYLRATLGWDNLQEVATHNNNKNNNIISSKTIHNRSYRVNTKQMSSSPCHRVERVKSVEETSMELNWKSSADLNTGSPRVELQPEREKKYVILAKTVHGRSHCACDTWAATLPVFYRTLQPPGFVLPGHTRRFESTGQANMLNRLNSCRGQHSS